MLEVKSWIYGCISLVSHLFLYLHFCVLISYLYFISIISLYFYFWFFIFSFFLVFIFTIKFFISLFIFSNFYFFTATQFIGILLVNPFSIQISKEQRKDWRGKTIDGWIPEIVEFLSSLQFHYFRNSKKCEGIAVNLSFSFRTPTKSMKKSGTTIKRENESSSKTLLLTDSLILNPFFILHHFFFFVFYFFIYFYGMRLLNP